MMLREIYTECVHMGTLRAKGFKFVAIASLMDGATAKDEEKRKLTEISQDFTSGEHAIGADILPKLKKHCKGAAPELFEYGDIVSSALSKMRSMQARVLAGAYSEALLVEMLTLQTDEIFPTYTAFLGTIEVELQRVEAEQAQNNRSLLSRAIEDIDGISASINLIAVNAAIEAARVGDAGRGFALIATEIRSLSQKSKSAIDDIRVQFSA